MPRYVARRNPQTEQLRALIKDWGVARRHNGSEDVVTLEILLDKTKVETDIDDPEGVLRPIQTALWSYIESKGLTPVGGGISVDQPGEVVAKRTWGARISIDIRDDGSSLVEEAMQALAERSGVKRLR